MLVDLKELRDRGQALRVQRQFSESDLGFRNGSVRLEGPAQGTLTVTLQGDRVRVAGTVEATVKLWCCRCLNAFEQTVSKECDLEYEPDPEVEHEGEEIALSYGDLSIGFYRNDELDLAAFVGEQILLEIPMKPICQDDCKGLCPHCGADLNLGSCDCAPESIDPRFAELLRLKKKMTD